VYSVGGEEEDVHVQMKDIEYESEDGKTGKQPREGDGEEEKM